MTDQPLPMFDDAAPAPDAPKKPRRKPVKRQARKAIPPVVKRRARKQRVVKPKLADQRPSLAVMFDACARIADILRGLTVKERTAVLESVGHIA